MFMAALLEGLGGQLREVRINKLVAETFYAAVTITGPAGVVTLDARPSDALNLALLAHAPIRVESAVLEANEAWKASQPTPALSDVPDAAAGPSEIVANLITGSLKEPAEGRP
jgi:bifunctional DNase/RNase